MRPPHPRVRCPRCERDGVIHCERCDGSGRSGLIPCPVCLGVGNLGLAEKKRPPVPGNGGQQHAHSTTTCENRQDT